MFEKIPKIPDSFEFIEIKIITFDFLNQSIYKILSCNVPYHNKEFNRIICSVDNNQM